MSRYRKIDVRIWNDEKFVGLSDRGKLAFILMLTHPHMTSLGAMRGSLPGLAAELGWTSEDFREAFQEALEKGLVKHDEKHSCIWLPNFLKYNGPESPNVVRSWVKCFDLVPECRLKDELCKQVKAFVEGLGQAFREAFRKTMPNQEQEQEQEQEKETPPNPLKGELGGAFVDSQIGSKKRHPKVLAAAHPAVSRIIVGIDTVEFADDAVRWQAEFIDRWNQLPGVSQHDAKTLSTFHLRELKARLSEADWFWERAFERFPLWLPDRVWEINLGTFLKDGTVANILDGKYDQRNESSRGPHGIPSDEITRIRTGKTEAAVAAAFATANANSRAACSNHPNASGVTQSNC